MLKQEWLFIKYGRILNIAHRGGLVDVSVNILDAIVNSINSGADAVEVDIQETSDHKLFIFHDEKIAINGKKYFIRNLTMEQINTAYVGTKRMPLLEEVLRIVRNSRLFLILDIKSSRHIVDIINIIDHYEMSSRVIVVSFNPCYLLKVKRISRQMPTGLVVGFSRLMRRPVGLVGTIVGLLFPVQFAIYLDVNVILCSEDRITKNLVNQAHNVSFPVWVWLGTECFKPDKLVKMRIDGIMSFCIETFKGKL